MSTRTDWHTATMDESEYHARPELSASVAKQLIQPGGPARWRWEHDHGRRETKAFDVGHAAHKLVLGVGAEIAVIPDTILASNGAASTKDAKAFVAEARERGAVPLKQAEHDMVQGMALALWEHPEARRLLAPNVGTEVEVSGFATHPETGVALRCRWDAISADGIVDYKSGHTADPSRWVRDAAKLGNHLQAAHYRWMAAHLGLTDGPLRFVVQEKTAPYLVSVIRLGEATEALGTARMREAMDIWGQAQALDLWPGYGPDEHVLDFPHYLMPFDESDY